MKGEREGGREEREGGGGRGKEEGGGREGEWEEGVGGGRGRGGGVEEVGESTIAPFEPSGFAPETQSMFNTCL